MTVALITHTSCQLHSNGLSYHPECGERLGAINNRMITSGVDWILHHYDAEPATTEQLLRVHDKHYVDHVFKTAPTQGHVMLDGDTGMNSHSLEAALHAAGAAVKAVDIVMSGEQKQAFCSVRPPGHHAAHAKSSGFCIFNNVAVGAAHAMQAHGLERVVIIDFDVHHGDGTENIFTGDNRVLFCSSFQHPYFPFSGADSKAPNILNLPMPAGTNGGTWAEAVETSWFPAIHDFKPQLIMISAGFDSHLEDDMGGFNLLERDYAWITIELCRLAQQYAEGRIVSCLEGGYDLSSLGRSATTHIKEMAEFH